MTSISPPAEPSGRSGNAPERRRIPIPVVAGLVLALVLVAGVALVLALRDHDHGSATTSTTSTTTLHAPTTGLLPTTPQGFARALYAAWKAGDRATAARVASPEAVGEIFAVPYQPVATRSGPVDPYHPQRCEGAAGSTFCSWASDGQRLVVQVRNATGGLPVLVIRVERDAGSP